MQNTIKFKQFLTKHGAYFKYMLAMDDNITEFCSRNPKIKYLSRAFTWDDTTQGFMYWAKLDNLWQKEIRR